MRKIYSILLLFCCLVGFKQANASHCAGGELVYRWVSDSTYRVTFKLYYDCSGTTNEPSNVEVCYVSTCVNSINRVTLQKLALLPDGSPNGSTVSTGCGGYLTKCESANATLPGYREWYYEGDVTLPHRCSSWQFSVAIKDRNSSYNLTGGSNNPFYVYTTLNNLVAQGNSSPAFSVKPVPFVCAGNPYTYNNGVYDIDGDSLSYEIVQPQEGDCGSAGVPIPFLNGQYNTTNNPIPTNNTFVLDPVTGQLSFIPITTVNASTLTFKVNEYRNRVLIGSIVRDIQVQTRSCNSIQPVLQADTINIVGGTRINGRIESCSNTPLNFCFKVKSPNASAILVASDNHVAVAPGSAVSYTGQRTDSIQGCFSWIPSANDTGLRNFTVTLKDSTCLPPGIAVSQTFIIPIFIHAVTYISKDTSICAGTNFMLRATGGNTFTWTVLPGGSPLSTLSCTNCSNPIASPAVTTRYVVTSDLSSFCNKNADTVTIIVNQLPPQPQISSNSPICVGDSLRLYTTAIAGTYVWTGPAGFHSSAQNPIVANGQLPNTGTYQLITKNGNCSSPATTIAILVARAPNLPVITGDHIVCEGNTLRLNAANTGIIYRWTGPNSFTSTRQNLEITNATQLQAGTYYVTAYNTATLSCPSSRDSFSVVVSPKVDASFELSRENICAGDTLALTSTGNGASIINRNWQLDGGILESGVGAGPYVVRYNREGVKTIVLTVSNAGCTDSLQKTLNVYALPPSDFNIKSEACLDEPVRIKAGEFVSVDLNVSWDFAGGQVIDGHSTGPYNVRYSTPGYKVITFTTENQYCRSLVTSDTIYVHPTPDARILSTSLNNTCAGDLIRFTAAVHDDYTYTWKPERFFSNGQPVIDAAVAASGYVTLIVADSLGCTASDSVMITTKPCCTVTMPNAFTPNGDTRNDIFRMVTAGHPVNSKMMITNRWGQVVFTSADPTIGWDGTVYGKPMDMGTYYYYVRYQCVDNQYYELKGEVTLIR